MPQFEHCPGCEYNGGDKCNGPEINNYIPMSKYCPSLQAMLYGLGRKIEALDNVITTENNLAKEAP